MTDTQPKPIVQLSVDQRPSTNRTVFILCASEKKWTEHRFSRIDYQSKSARRLMFACRDCTEERVYGVEG